MILLTVKFFTEMFGSESEEDPFQDSGSDYQPSRRNSTTSTTDLLQLLGDDNQSLNASNSEVVEHQSKPRKRVRHPSKWKKNMRKEKRSRGEEYINVKGVTVPPKQIDTARECNCQQKCHEKILPNQQLKLFNSYYAMGNYNLQSSYLFSLIKVLPKKTCRVLANRNTAESRRTNSRVYQVPNDDGLHVTICKGFFKNVFGVSDGRLSRILKNKLVIPTPPIDQRGKHVPSNKTPEHKMQIVKDFINKFPKYESHYTLHKSTNRMFLAPDLSLSKLISIYKNEIPLSEQVSNFMFRKVFNEQFNLSFHPPITDSCKKCDSFKIKIQAEESPSKKDELEVQRKLHLLKADSARNNFKIDKKRAEDDSDNITVIVFDLMKTLPTPVISTGICYYKRQLWTYCLGIHNAQNDNVTMCVWNETIASRGPQEVGSCLLRYIKEKVNTKHLIMYSDQCGGQNRNIKMAALCQYIVAHPDYTVETIDHKFYVSGHSYLSCDQDFGLVEKKKKFFKNIFVPDNWVEVIKAARDKNPFNIMNMTKDDFFPQKSLKIILPTGR